MDMLTTRRSIPPSGIRELQEQMSACVDDVALWTRSNRLQLNTGKTEVLWCATGHRQHQIPHHPVRIGDWIFPADSIRNLGIYLDSDASMRVHVSKTVSNCFAALRQITEYTKVCPKAGAGVTGRLSGLVTPRLRQTSPVFQGTSSIGCTPY